jgi:hypothetical protein
MLSVSYTKVDQNASIAVVRRRAPLILLFCIVVLANAAQLAVANSLVHDASFPTGIRDHVPVRDVTTAGFYVVCSFGCLLSVHKKPPQMHSTHVVVASMWRRIDPDMVLALAISYVCAGATLGLAIPSPLVFDAVFVSLTMVPPALFTLFLMLRLMRKRTLTERHDEDIRAVIAVVKRSLDKGWNTPDPIKVLLTGTFVISLMLQMGHRADKSTGLFFGATMPVSIQRAVDLAKQSAFWVHFTVIFSYAVLCGCLALLKSQLVRLPKQFLEILLIAWRLMYTFFLISAMRLLLNGFVCEPIMFADGHQNVSSLSSTHVLTMDPGVACDYGYQHREHMLFGCWSLFVFVVGPAIYVSTYTLNSISEPFPRYLPLPTLLRLSVYYLLVLLDSGLLTTAPEIQIGVAGVLIGFLLAWHVYEQPCTGPGIVPNSTWSSILSVAVYAIIISGIRHALPEQEATLFYAFVGASSPIGALAYFLNRTRASLFEKRSLVDAALKVCRRATINEDEADTSDAAVSAQVLEIVFSCSEAHWEGCKQDIDRATDPDPTSEAREVCRTRLHQLELLATTALGCKLMRQHGIIPHLLVLLTSETDRVIGVLSILLGAQATNALMRAEIRKKGGLLRILDAWVYWSTAGGGENTSREDVRTRGERRHQSVCEDERGDQQERRGEDATLATEANAFGLVRLLGTRAKLFSLLDLLRNPDEHFVLVRGARQAAEQLHETKVVKRGLHTFHLLPRYTLLSSCVDFVVFLVHAAVWRDPGDIKKLADELKQLARTSHRVAPSSTILLCTIPEPARGGPGSVPEDQAYSVPEGFPYHETPTITHEFIEPVLLPVPAPAALEEPSVLTRACEDEHTFDALPTHSNAKRATVNLHGRKRDMHVTTASDASKEGVASMLSPIATISKKLTVNLQGRKRDMRVNAAPISDGAASVPLGGGNPFSPGSNPLLYGSKLLSPGGTEDAQSAVPIVLLRVDLGDDWLSDVTVRLAIMIEKNDLAAEDEVPSAPSSRLESTPKRGRRIPRRGSIALKKMGSLHRMLAVQGRISRFGSAIGKDATLSALTRRLTKVVPAPQRLRGAE